MNANAKLSPSYTLDDALMIREAFELVGFTPRVNSRGFIEAAVGNGSVVVRQDDNVVILSVRSEHNMVEGEMRLSGSLNSAGMLAAMIVELAK